ncbi:MAG TPA: NUDIX hydrolase [Flavisolibacter sp.]|nr:NUDIX hydrolase [Flavisolibacter sp.]
MKWKVLESQYLFNEPWLTIRKDKCELPNGQVIPSFYVNEYPDWVNAFALTKEGQVLMVKQYRHGIGEIGIELPGGVVDEGETPEYAMKRELMEETGYKFDSILYLGKISANPSTTNNYMHMYLATGGVKVAEQSLDDGEDVEVLYMSIDEVKQLVKENKIFQSLHVNCIFYALHHLGEMQY